MGTDLNSLDDAKDLGITLASVSFRDNVINNYSHINSYAACYHSASTIDDFAIAEQSFACSLEEDTTEYSAKNGIAI